MNKTELLAAFSDYLEAQETKPETHEAYDQQTDMYSLFVEMSTLKNEVKTQARQFKTAMDDFREVFHSLKEQQSYLEHELNKKTTVGTISYMPMMFGAYMASHVIRCLAEIETNEI